MENNTQSTDLAAQLAALENGTVETTTVSATKHEWEDGVKEAFRCDGVGSYMSEDGKPVNQVFLTNKAGTGVYASDVVLHNTVEEEADRRKAQGLAPYPFLMVVTCTGSKKTSQGGQYRTFNIQVAKN